MKTETSYKKIYNELLEKIAKEAMRLKVPNTVLYSSSPTQHFQELAKEPILKEKQIELIAIYQSATDALKKTLSDLGYSKEELDRFDEINLDEIKRETQEQMYRNALETFANDLTAGASRTNETLSKRRQSFPDSPRLDRILEAIGNLLRKAGIREVITSKRFASHLRKFSAQYATKHKYPSDLSKKEPAATFRRERK